MVFPLPLSPMEQYMLLDDRPEEPMVFYFRLHFSGRLQREPFDSALQAVLARQPLLRAVIASTPEGGQHWVPAGKRRPAVDWAEDDDVDYAAADRLDLTAQPGYRIWVRVQDDRTQLVFQVHHSCCDGIGVVDFLGDLLVAYAAAAEGRPIEPALRPLDEALLPDRNRFGLTLGKRLRRLPNDMVGIARALQFALRRGEPLALPGPSRIAEESDWPAGAPLFSTHRTSEDALQRLRTAARAYQATLNDLLLRDLFLAVYDWNAQHGRASGVQKVRVMLPINLRQPGDARLPAANVVVMSFLDRAMRGGADAAGLLRGVRNRTRLIKRLQLGLTGAQVVKFLVDRGLLGGMLARDQCLATTVLSNLGEVFRNVPLPRVEGRLQAGNAQLDQVEAYPPIRRKTWAAFGVLSYAGRLTVGLHCRRGPFNESQAQDLLQTYVERLNASAEQGAG